MSTLRRSDSRRVGLKRSSVPSVSEWIHTKDGDPVKSAASAYARREGISLERSAGTTSAAVSVDAGALKEVKTLIRTVDCPLPTKALQAGGLDLARSTTHWLMRPSLRRLSRSQRVRLSARRGGSRPVEPRRCAPLAPRLKQDVHDEAYSASSCSTSVRTI